MSYSKNKQDTALVLEQAQIEILTRGALDSHVPNSPASS